VAGGATAAARASRLDGQQLDITIVERSPDVSFANCGLPYFIGGEIKDRSRLALQTPESLSASLGVRVLTNTEALKIDRAGKTVSIRNAQGATSQLPYDTLILSPGASPLRPPVPGVNDPRVLSLRNLQDMDAIVAAIEEGHVWMVEQWRPPLRRRCWELPMGVAPGGDATPIEEAARIELREETGLTVARMDYLGDLAPAPALLAQTGALFLATGLTQGPQALEHGEQDLVAARMAVGEVVARILSGEIADAVTVAAFGLLRLREVI
jgi:8-oxo-dGTP pyrophosphatase MutT (NUDIX family)